MRNIQTYIGCFLILIGTVVMFLSILRYKKLFPLIRSIRTENRTYLFRLPKIHMLLMIFFLIGYVIVAIAFYLKLSIVSELFVGLIFMFGAFFVFLGVIVQNILNTEHNKMEKTLSQSEDNLKTIISSVQAGIMIVNAETHQIIDINPVIVKMFGADKDKIIGSLCHKFICPAEKGKCPITDLCQSVDNSERVMVGVNNELIPVLKTVVPIMLNNRKLLLESFVDITERKQSEKENERLQTKLLQTEKMAAVGQLAGGVAHEINNPMGVILGFAQILMKKITEDDPLYMPLKSIEREAERCKKLVTNLLTFSRIGKTLAEATDINETIEEAVSFINAQTKVRMIELVKKYGNKLPPIMIKKNQIQQVLLNLCNNAIDAMPTGGRLTIATKQVEQQIVVEISDTGKGMTEEVKKHLFEPFFTTKEVGKGTGLGLSICYEIIQKHNGTIEVESEVEKGSCFKIKLPAGKA
jgi:PAS domain S-box-containing protein